MGPPKYRYAANTCMWGSFPLVICSCNFISCFSNVEFVLQVKNRLDSVSYCRTTQRKITVYSFYTTKTSVQIQSVPPYCTLGFQIRTVWC